MHWRCLQGWRLEYEWHVAVFAKYRSLRGLRKCRARGLEVVEWAWRCWLVRFECRWNETPRFRGGFGLLLAQTGFVFGREVNWKSIGASVDLCACV